MGREVLIGLIGVTGSGKTTFASIASGQSDLKIGRTLRSCTQEPQVVRFEVDGHSIVLVDTPGFDDDERSDVEIFQIIAKWLWLYNSGERRLLLDGLILFHPITANRIGGTERERTRLLQTILGENAYKRVIIGTTMWDDLRNDDDRFTHGIDGRLEEGEVWSEMNAKGATILRHNNNKDSAHGIIRQIIQKSEVEGGGVQLQLRQELIDVKGNVSKTRVGREVKRHIKDKLQVLNDNLRELDSSNPQAQVSDTNLQS
ncbi:P-loop containing nucleoside triphosphate hydrolase protein [Chaetomium fimeti]|uniref:P-loop containing nucleoside triphosphate hydrolase protein n=1 Tax=Chaetomium fimeti TaxID=1854472 RepID=A0AAE0HNM9_9PEZI|nr:P-loop containing nucleoside triphosphate hydrolase protein [Chaetomium fimeti]